jgi:cell division transport system ATP-binding protein
MNIFARFNEVGVTVLIASHDVHLIDRFGARRVIVEGGRIAGTIDTPPEVPSMMAS